MSKLKLTLSLFLGTCGIWSCKQAEQKAGATTTGTTTTTTTGSSDVSTSDADAWEDGYYTGFNGTDKFSFYLPSFRKMTITDSSIASIQEESYTPSTETVNKLIAERKAKDPNFNETRMREMLSKPRTVYKVTPLKAGSTTLKTAASGNGPGGDWKKGKSVAFVVTGYTQDLVAKGKARYQQSGAGTSVSCISCHEGGSSGAPPHALGTIMSLPDLSAAKWISTGQVAGRTASVAHAWSFASEDEKLGVVAYLRTLQAADYETLTKLEFENHSTQVHGPR